MHLSQIGRAPIVVLIFAIWGVRVSAEEPNPLYDELMKGVDVGASKAALLPKPVMPDGLDASAQRAALEKIPGRAAAQPVPRMLQKSIEAPFVLNMKTQGETADARIQQVDLYFVVYSDLDHISDEEFLKEKAEEERQERATERKKKGEPEPEGEQQAKSLTVEELAARGIKLLTGDAEREGYSHGSAEIFDRVLSTGTSHSLRTRNSESLIVASRLDPRFAEDPEYPNFWQSIERDELGRAKYGKKQPYFGSGTYTKATTLREPKGAMFIEIHTIFREPNGWFNKTNLLSSKLPIAARDNIRKFRRKLEDPAKKNPVAAARPAASS
ncbi:MAG: hypothetical protein K2Y37_14850 [Pirellulales bacterium]|nr:hypothetical protein [Pirellulales bacterium]